jgi:ABC-type polysaccharide/polyol phosphate export permease
MEQTLSPSTTVIKPSKGWVTLRLRDLWKYRELLYFLTWRDIKVRYKQTDLGALWAIIHPFFTMVAFSLFFGRLAKISSDGINPMVGVVEGFLWALLGTDTAPGAIIFISALTSMGLLISGVFYFKRVEKFFADII